MVGYYLLIWIELIPLLAPHCEPNGFYDGGDNDDSDDDGKDTCQYICFQYLRELESQSPSSMRPPFPTLCQIFDNANQRTAISYGSGTQNLEHPWSVQTSRMSSTIPLFKSICQAIPICMPIAFHLIMQIPPLEPPRSLSYATQQRYFLAGVPFL